MKHRKMIISLAAIFAVLALLNGCATDISTRGTQVKLVSAEQAHVLEFECRFIGNVIGSSHWYQLTFSDVAYSNALNRLLDNAAEIGATHVFVNHGNYRDLRGESYYCAYCELADGTADQTRCEDTEGYQQKAKDREQCEKNGYIWVNKALDRVSCEAIGGTWKTDLDVLRILPFSLPSTHQKK